MRVARVRGGGGGVPRARRVHVAVDFVDLRQRVRDAWIGRVAIGGGGEATTRRLQIARARLRLRPRVEHHSLRGAKRRRGFRPGVRGRYAGIGRIRIGRIRIVVRVV